MKKDINLIRSILEDIQTEGFFKGEKAAFWIEELPNLVKGLSEVHNAATAYKKKLKPEDKEGIALEFTIEVEAGRKGIFKKEKRGKTFMKLTLIDANTLQRDIKGRVTSKGIVEAYKIGEWKYETKLNF